MTLVLFFTSILFAINLSLFDVNKAVNKHAKTYYNYAVVSKEDKMDDDDIEYLKANYEGYRAYSISPNHLYCDGDKNDFSLSFVMVSDNLDNEVIVSDYFANKCFGETDKEEVIGKTINLIDSQNKSYELFIKDVDDTRYLDYIDKEDRFYQNLLNDCCYIISSKKVVDDFSLEEGFAINTRVSKLEKCEYQYGFGYLGVSFGQIYSFSKTIKSLRNISYIIMFFSASFYIYFGFFLNAKLCRKEDSYYNKLLIIGGTKEDVRFIVHIRRLIIYFTSFIFSSFCMLFFEYVDKTFNVLYDSLHLFSVHYYLIFVMLFIFILAYFIQLLIEKKKTYATYL